MNKKLIPLILITIFIFPIIVNIGGVLAVEVYPVLQVSMASVDLFGTFKHQADQRHVVVNNSGTLEIYYVKADNKVYRWISSETAIYTKVETSMTIRWDAIIKEGDYLYCMGWRVYTGTTWYSIACKLTLDGTEIWYSVSANWGNFKNNEQTSSPIIASKDGTSLFVMQRNAVDGYRIVKCTTSGSFSIADPSIDSTLSYMHYPFYIGNSENIGFISICTSAIAYSLIVNKDTMAITKTTHSISSLGISVDYPARIIENNINQALSGTLTGRVTIHGSPYSGSGLAFWNFYVVDDAWGWEFRQYSPLGYSDTTKGCDWAYHSGADTISLSWYKSLYTADNLYTATITFGTDNKIATIGVNVNPTVSDYPVMLNPVWIAEFVCYEGTTSNSTVQWFKNHGYPDYSAGDYRIEYNTYGATSTNFYSVQGIPVTYSAPPSGEYSIGDIKFFGTYNLTASNMTNGYVYYIKQGLLGGSVKITTVAVGVNESFVNVTCNHTFGIFIWQDNELKYSSNVTTYVNGTAVYEVFPEVILTGGTTRVGIISFGDNILGEPLGIGWHPENSPSYRKLYFENITLITWLFEGELLYERLAIRFDYISGGGGYQYNGSAPSNVTSIITNGTINFNYNQSTNVSVGGSTITTPTSSIGTSIGLMFDSWGYGAYVGGLIIWSILFFGMTFALYSMKMGMGQSTLLISLAFSTFLSFGLGLLDITIFVVFVLLVIMVGSYTVVDKFGGRGG